MSQRPDIGNGVAKPGALGPNPTPTTQRQVLVRERSASGATVTELEIVATVAYPAGSDGRPAVMWEVATGLEGLFLPKDSFSNARIRGIINRRGRLEKGRVVVCRRKPDDEVFAAVSVHVSAQRKAPLIIQEMLLRSDMDARMQSRRCVIWILGLLLDAADRLDRPKVIGVEIDKSENASDYTEIGFRRCSRPAGYRPEHVATAFYAVW